MWLDRPFGVKVSLLCVPVPGLLPGTGQHKLHILFYSGHHGEGFFSCCEKYQKAKAKPLNIEDGPWEKGRVFKAENVKL